MYDLKIKINGVTEGYNSIEELKTAYKKTKEENMANLIDKSKLILLETDNNELRKQLNYYQKKPYKFVGADVIGKNIEPLASTLIINRGRKDGIQENQPVIVSEGILIGVITRVENDTAIVRLLDDNQSKIAASMISKDKSIGLIEGGYGISIKMTFVPQSEVVNVGDTVVTSGLQEKIPRGLLVGTVEAVEKEAFQPFQTAVLKPLAELDKINMVSVIISL